MADLRISELPVLLGTDAEAEDDLAIADYSSSETRRLTLKDAVQQGVSALIDDAVIPGAKLVADSVTATQIADDAVTASELADNSVDTAAIVDGAITSAKFAAGSVDTTALAAEAVTDAKVASGIDGAKLTDNTVTNDKLTTGIDGAKLLADSVTAAQIAADAITSSELADGAVDTAAIIDGAVTNVKLASGIDGTKISADTITAAQIQANAITSSELADNSVDTAAIINSAVTDAKIASGIAGSKISDGTVTDAKLATGIDGTKLTAGSVDAAKLDTVTDRGLDQTTGSIGHTNSVTAGTHSGITFDAQGHITGTAALVAADLPVATESTIGAVSIPADSGLTVTALGVVDHANNVTGATISGITYDEHGHIVSAAALTAGDLPIATEDNIGGVAVPPGSALTVSGTGDLEHEDSAVVIGTYTKVTVDQKGHVTAGATLTDADIPSLDASKITTGTFSSGFLAPNSVTAEQLADYGIAQVSESQPIPEFAGQWWINPSDRSAYIWIGTVTPEPNGYWLLVGYGSPTQLNLRFGGTYDATANTIVSLNQYGVEAGLTVGQALSAPNTANNGVYLAVTTAGTGTTPAPVVSLAVGDWVLSQGTGANWTKVAVVSGASGTFNDYDILCDGTYFTPDMTAVADVRDALELIWGRVQIATSAQIGVVKESSEVVVDNSTGEMTIGVVDDGTY